MIKLIASDMDGTLLDGEGNVPPETFDLIKRLKTAGIGFVAGVLVAVAWDRHMKRVDGLRCHVVEIVRACSGM